MGSLWLLTILSKRPHPSASALHSPKVKTKHDNVCLESKSELVHLTHRKKIEVTKWHKKVSSWKILFIRWLKEQNINETLHQKSLYVLRDAFLVQGCETRLIQGSCKQTAYSVLKNLLERSVKYSKDPPLRNLGFKNLLSLNLPVTFPISLAPV